MAFFKKKKHEFNTIEEAKAALDDLMKRLDQDDIELFEALHRGAVINDEIKRLTGEAFGTAKKKRWWHR